TYILSINGTGAGGCDGNTVGDLGANQTMTITGAGAATTIIRQTGTGPANDGDRVMCMNEPFTLDLIYNFSGVTFVGGRDGTAAGTGTALGGGGIIGGEKGNVLTLTNVVFANNQVTVLGSANIGGGGIQWTGGSLNITNSTFGGSAAPGAYTDRTSTTTGNLNAGSGGGVMFTPSAPAHTASTGILTVAGSTFTRNTAGSISSGGGGADLLIFAFASPGGFGTGSATIGTSTFSNNTASPGNGGGILVESLATTVATTSLTNNSAGNRGGGIYVGGASLLLNGTTPTITFSGNTAVNAGSSVSTASAVNVSGTNTTIGGDIEISTLGSWTNNAGSTLAPTNVVVTGGTFTMNNSTMNVGGNLTIGPGPVVGSTFNGNTGTVNIQGNLVTNSGGAGPVTTFNAGTGTFNFNGTGAQSISGTLNPTFFNLTDSNVTNPLTISNSIAVSGTLNVNGANAILAPAATSVISGAGTLTGTGTARVTRTLATADFSSQYTITNKTLTNLTVEYIGTAAQVLSPITFGPLKINNGNGVNITSGTSTVNGLLTLTTGALGVGNQILVINNGSSVVAGSITSNPTGTVNYNQSSNGQNVRAFNYGNLTFSNFTKVLEPAGTIGISGVFTPGTAIGHTITGSTINFNGTGAQTVPAFNYNNLTISGARGANNVTLANAGTIGVAGIFNPIATFAGGNYVITNNTVDFNGSGGQTIPAFNYFNLTSSNVGARTLANSGIIGIASLFTPGTNVYTITGSTVAYNGTSPQTLPATFTTYFNLTSNNAAGVTGFAGLTVQALLRMQTGTFTSNSGTYNNVQIDSGATLAGTNGTTINVSGNWTNNGTFTANTNTVNFNGSGAQVIGGSSVSTFNNLTIANAGSGVSLGQNATVNAVLTLTNNLTTGANILTMPNTGTSAGTADVIGNVRRTGFAGGGPALSFGNPFNSIGFIAQGTVPTDILVNLVKATPTGPPTFPTAVQRTYTITPTGGAGYSATLRLHYLDAELNGNVETDLGLWRLFGGAWARQGRSGSVDLVNNWAELSGVTQFSPWTLASAKNDTTTTITSDNPDPSGLNQVVTVNYTVTSNVGGAPPVTGNVTITVNDASGDTCSGTVAAGTCALTLTTPGSKTLTATYSSDANFNTSLGTTPHQVVIPDVVVKDAHAAEPSSGTTTMLFTVTLSSPSTGAASVNYATADNGSAVGGADCTGGADYVTASGFLNFNTGQQIQTIPVTVCSDGTAEGDETFLMNLSTPVNVTITDGTATGTITAANPPGTVLISEVRTSGPGGVDDDFVEIYNNTDTPLNVAASDASAGFGLFKMGAACGDSPVLVGTIPNGTVIPARGHYLVVGSAYSLTNYGGTGAAAGNLPLTTNIESDRNIGLFTTTSVANLSTETRRDAVGFGSNTGNNCDLLREPTNLATANDSTSEYSFVRKLATGTSQDTNDNVADFQVITTTPATPVGTNATPTLGGAGPENLASPIQRNATIKASLIDTGVASTTAPNRIRDTTPDPANNSTFGTLLFRRKFTNNTGAPVTRLRFRIVDVTTFPVPGGTADLRARTIGPATVTITGGSMVSVQGTVLETPPAQPNAGGYNSTLSAVTVTLATPIAVGATINVQLLTGVQQNGSFRFFINVEALP
ncbi:MAG: Calx-beta domain-containing protein, partial [Pyrinomonadaceae bacterium]